MTHDEYKEMYQQLQLALDAKIPGRTHTTLESILDNIEQYTQNGNCIGEHIERLLYAVCKYRSSYANKHNP